MRVDWHIHTVLSPCASLDMSPLKILEEAENRGLNAIGICDHNSTRQARYMADEAKKKGICILPGVELNSREEIHCLAFFDDLKALDEMQAFIDAHLPNIRNVPELFGDQVVVDLKGRIIYEEERMLLMALTVSLDSLVNTIRALGGLVIPAHANKGSNSLLSQLGFVPDDMDFDAVEIIGMGDEQLRKYPWVLSSDAHYPEDIGRHFTSMNLDDFSVNSIRSYFNRSVSGEVVK